MISILLLNNFYPVFNNFYHTDELKKKATIYCVRFGHSLWSAVSCQTQVVKVRLVGCKL